MQVGRRMLLLCNRSSGRLVNNKFQSLAIGEILFATGKFQKILGDGWILGYQFF